MQNYTVRQALTIYAYLARARGGFRFDTKRGDYVYNSNSKTVTQAKLNTEIDAYIERVADNVEFQTNRYLDGKISLPEWQRQMKREMRDSWRTQYALGKGGFAQMSQADYGRLGGRLNFQYRQFNGFAQAIKNDELSPDQIRLRASMYADARTGFYDGRTSIKDEAGFTEEQRVLDASPKVKHCDDCTGYAAAGWVPIGTLPEPGQSSQCLSRCRCDKEYR